MEGARAFMPRSKHLGKRGCEKMCELGSVNVARQRAAEASYGGDQSRPNPS